MNNDVTHEIKKHLATNVQVLWSGRPKQGVIFRGSDAFMIPFSLLWGGFAFFWEYTVLTQGAPIVFALFGIPFVVLGLYLIVGRFYIEAKQREKTYYAITSERVVIITGIFRKKIKSLALRTLSNVSLNESRGSTGSISFGDSFPFAGWFGGMAWPGIDQLMGPRLDAIENPQKVYQLIHGVQRNAT